MNSYHFDLGNSSVGPIGYCARLEANSKAEAVARLRAMLPEVIELTDHDLGTSDDELGENEYIHVYFNYDTSPTEADIDEVQNEHGDEVEEQPTPVNELVAAILLGGK